MSDEGKAGEATASSEKKDAEQYWEARPPAERGHFQFDIHPGCRVVKFDAIPVNK